MLKNRKTKILIAFLALFLCVIQIKQTYAKYLDSKEGDTNFTVAKWKITVNNQDITEAATMSSLITPVYTQNDNVADNVIAPGSEGYFDLIIDGSKTDVSFKYILSASCDTDSSVQDLVITGYSVNSSSVITVDSSLNNITNAIRYTDTNKVVNIRVYFKWKDGDGETMNNDSDTQASTSGKDAKIKASISLIQVVN